MLLGFAFTGFSQVVIITNKSNDVKQISYIDLLLIYKSKLKKWPNGLKIKVTDFDESTEVKKEFYKKIRRTPQSIKNIWLRKRLLGEAKLPKNFTSEDEMLHYISKTPGAIGYISKAKVTGKVKVLYELN